MVLLRQAQQQGESAGALVLADPQAEILGLQNERSRLREQLRGIQDEEGEFEKLLLDGEGYAREASEQRARLATIGLVKATDLDHSQCPLCNSAVATPTPAAQDIAKALRQIGTQLDTVVRDRPQLEAHRRGLTQRRDELVPLVRTEFPLG